MKREDYPQIDYYSMTKEEWDSIFAMIPWLEKIEKISPEEMSTDHGGTRTRPLKYVEYKSASVQLIGRVFKLLKPFDWANWDEGIKILKDQSFTGLNLETIAKLLTIILYYKESTGELSPFGIHCQAHDLEDGRVLKLLKELKIIIHQELKNECEKYQAYYPQDSEFARYGRLLQSKWRKKNGYPIGKSDRGSILGNYISSDYAKNKKANFLTENIRNLVVKELDNSKETKALIREDRMWCNLLSSQPLCFNLFGELRFNPELATTFFKILFPERVNKVTSILFEYSPCRGDNNFTGDHSAFDVFIEYESNEGKNGFIGIEVKYAETLKEGADKVDAIFQKHEKEYLKIADFQTADIFKKESIENIKKSPLFQIWRDHLLSIALLKNNLYEEGFFVFLFPKANEECYQGVQQYTEQLTFPYKFQEEKTGFYWRFLDDFIEALDGLVNQHWTKELKERYLGK